ncbi:MAG: hypothetical protein AAF725_18420, partial [Acidobacteriota bacterium]
MSVATPRRRPLRRLGLLLALTLLAAAAAAWWWRDLPRLWLIAKLEGTTGGEVDLERLSFPESIAGGSTAAVLEGLTIRRPEAFPGLRRVTVRRLTVRGEPMRLRRGEIDDLVAQGVVADFDEVRPPPADDGEPPVRLTGRLRVPGAKLRMAAPRAGLAATAAVLDVDLERSGDRWLGRADLTAPAVDLAAIFSALGRPRLSGTLVELRAGWRAEPDRAAERLEILASSLDLGLEQERGDFGEGPPPAAQGRLVDLRLGLEGGPSPGAFTLEGGAREARVEAAGGHARLSGPAWTGTLENGAWRLAVASGDAAGFRATAWAEGEEVRGSVRGLETRAVELRLPGVAEVDAAVDLEVRDVLGEPAIEAAAEVRSVRLENGTRLELGAARVEIEPSLKAGVWRPVPWKIRLDGPPPAALANLLPRGLELETPGAFEASGVLTVPPASRPDGAPAFETSGQLTLRGVRARWRGEASERDVPWSADARGDFRLEL